MIDTHAHLNDPKFASDLDAVIERARNAGVEAIVVCGSDLPTSLSAVGIASSHEHCYATVGIHPHDARNLTQTDMRRLRALCGEARVVAVGETGLDFHYDFSPRADQIAAFEQHLALARDVGLPVVVHSREAHADTMATIRAAGGLTAGVFHCFSGNLAQAEEVLELGCCIGVDGPVTYKNADRLRALVEMCPLDRLVIETDCPYLSPMPHRGKRNEPAYVRFVCDEVARIKRISREETAQATTANTRRLFRRIE